ncbi:EpsG family protein [Collinsella ihumii]|uniref:EpsG family protein n=1 Tax=Collinsella ihumii TaxID=1720204 RepID=UPI0025AA578A|nr:EpsG family protein [Collinsella ihumii]MDN0056496.1 EpsG family protein [Collinsella ihumii]
MGVFENIGSIGWDSATYWLYVAVAALAGFLSWLSFAGISRAGGWKPRKVPSLLAMALLIVFKGFCVSTTDVKAGYYLNFMSATSFESFRDYTLEPLYQALNVAVRNITPDYGVFLMVVAVITIAPVGFVIWKCRSRINVPFAVLGYSLVYLVTGMSAIRQAIAVSFVLLGVYHWVFGKKHLAVLWSVVALGFHTSALVALLLYVLLFFHEHIKMQVIISVATVAVVIAGRAVVETLFVGRYGAYSAFDDVSFGIAVVLKYLPLAALILFVLENDAEKRVELHNGSSSLLGLCTAVLLFSVVVCMLGYVISIFGRAESYSAPLVIVLAYLVRRCEERRYFRLPVKFLLALYFLFRLTIYMNDFYLAEGIMPYVTSFGLRI